MSTSKPPQLASERGIINAPMSFAGAAQRAWRLRKGTGAKLALLTVLAVVLLIFWEIAVLFWYLLFGVFLIPYRLLRRGARKRKAEAKRHREMLAAIEQSKQTPG